MMYVIYNHKITTIEGERLRGKVLAGGGHWIMTKPDGTFEVDYVVTNSSTLTGHSEARRSALLSADHGHRTTLMMRPPYTRWP